MTKPESYIVCGVPVSKPLWRSAASFRGSRVYSFRQKWLFSRCRMSSRTRIRKPRTLQSGSCKSRSHWSIRNFSEFTRAAGNRFFDPRKPEKWPRSRLNRGHPGRVVQYIRRTNKNAIYRSRSMASWVFSYTV